MTKTPSILCSTELLDYPHTIRAYATNGGDATKARRGAYNEGDRADTSPSQAAAAAAAHAAASSTHVAHGTTEEASVKRLVVGVVAVSIAAAAVFYW